MMDTCQGIFGRLFGHRFGAVFDEEPTSPNPFGTMVEFRMTETLAREFIRANIKSTYRGIYCTRCGKREDA